MELSLGVQNFLQDSNMKKIVFPMLVFVLIVSACTAPTPTQMPIFTPVPNTNPNGNTITHRNTITVPYTHRNTDAFTYS
jgi:hypothetical protein